jgi:hypothetical protein
VKLEVGICGLWDTWYAWGVPERSFSNCWINGLTIALASSHAFISGGQHSKCETWGQCLCAFDVDPRLNKS